MRYCVDQIIRDRAKARREREAKRKLNTHTVNGWVKFTDWLLNTQGITNWSEVQKHKLYSLFLDYELECLKVGIEYEHPKIYGLKNTLMK